MKTKNYLAIILILFVIGLKGQNKSVGIGTTSPDPSAVLHLESTNQGFMMPHLTNTQITAITTPKNGLIIYSITDSCYWFYKANHWDKICGTVHQIDHYIYTDTLIANTATINTLHADSVFANYINTNFIHTDSIIANYGSFDTLLVGGQTINTVITNQIDSTAWLLKGNSGTNSSVNFMGTKDTAKIVFKQNNVGRMFISNYDFLNFKNPRVYIGDFSNTNIPLYSALDVNGQITMRFGAANNYIMQSNANGTGNWVAPSTILTPGNLNGGAWTILGNTGTNPTSNFLGTTDSAAFVIRQNNVPKIIVKGVPGFLGNVVTRVIIAPPSFNPTIFSELDVNGKITMRTGATNTYIMQSDANGTGNWVNPTTILTPGNLNGGAWTILGNSGTNPNVNYLGTSDLEHLVIRTNNIPRITVSKTGITQIGHSGNTMANDLLSVGGPTNLPYCLHVDNQGCMATSYGGAGVVSYGFVNKKSTGMYLDNFPTNGATTSIPATCIANNTVLNLQYGLNGDTSCLMLTHQGTPSISVHTNSIISYPYQNKVSRTGAYRKNLFMMGISNVYTDAGTGGYSCGNFSDFIFGGTNIVNTANDATCFVFGNNNVVTGNHTMVSQGISGPFVMGSFNNVVHNGVFIGVAIHTAFDNNIVISNGGGGHTPGANNDVVIGTEGRTIMYSNISGTAGVMLANGAGSWSLVSDRNKKENFIDIDNEDILKKLKEIKVTKWNYIAQRPDTLNNYTTTPYHIGPMAQDFYEKFGLGEYEDKISEGDMMGVMFAAIQALDERTKKITELEQQLADLKKLVLEIRDKK